MTLTQQTSKVLYTARAIGIILVVIGHYLWHPNWMWSPYLFHMPLFFVLGGIVAKPINDYTNWIRKVAKHYVGYYIGWYVAIGIITWGIVSFWDTRIVLNLSSGVDALTAPLRLNSHNNSLFMVGWFIVAYCLTSVLFQLYLTHFAKTTNALNTLLVGVMVGFMGVEFIAPMYHTERYWVWNLLCQVCVGWMYFTIGHTLKRLIDRANSLFVLIVSTGALATMVKLGIAHELGMSWSEYPDGFVIHLFASMLGVIAVFSVSYALLNIKGQHHLMWIGKQSKPIMTLHMLCFVILDLVLVQFNMLEASYISALHHYISPIAFWFYIAIGIYGPIALDALVKPKPGSEPIPSIRL